MIIFSKICISICSCSGRHFVRFSIALVRMILFSILCIMVFASTSQKTNRKTKRVGTILATYFTVLQPWRFQQKQQSRRWMTRQCCMLASHLCANTGQQQTSGYMLHEANGAGSQGKRVYRNKDPVWWGSGRACCKKPRWNRTMARHHEVRTRRMSLFLLCLFVFRHWDILSIPDDVFKGLFMTTFNPQMSQGKR